MTFNRRRMLAVLAMVAALSAYPVFVLGFTWIHVVRSELPGGKNGPLDAYRHTLASAVVAHTLSPKAVDLVTGIMEFQGKPSSLMDRHNNRIGAGIGTRSGSFAEIEPMVREQVLAGGIDVPEDDRVTWLPEEDWKESWLW